MLSDTDAIPVPPITPGVARALSPLIRRVSTESSEDYPNGENTYLIGIDEIVILNPAVADKAHIDLLHGCGGDSIRWILLTDNHGLEGAKELKKRTGAELIAPKNVTAADTQLKSGYSINATEFNLQAVKVNKRANEFGLFLEQERCLLTPASGFNPNDATTEKTINSKRVRSLAPAAGQYLDRI